ncbi:MAG: WYL domain-containing protein [Corynebacterium sp.]|nr:WYL domain-containing protein [Corynebacterium sp.]
MAEISSTLHLTNLLLALNLCLQRGKPLTLAWAMQNVEGYMPELAERRSPQPKTIERIRKRLSRDIQRWQAQGVAIDGDAAHGYQLNADDAFLPEIAFSPAELDLLAQVSAATIRNSFGEHARLGVLKLLSQQAMDAPTPQNTKTAVASIVDWNTSNPQDLARLNAALTAATVVNFHYVKAGQDPSQAKTCRIVPWGIVSHQNRLYVVGWNIDQGSQRLYRLQYMRQIQRTAERGPQAPEGFSAASAVEQWFAQYDPKVTARIRYEGSERLLLLEHATQVADGIYELQDVSQQWLISHAIAAAPAAVVIEPPEVRADIATRIKLAAQKVGA